MHPRILLAEDDPTTAAFLHAATSALPAEVDMAGSIAQARSLAHRHAHALWLFDAHLPDGSGADLLALLRADGLRTLAIAHTASHESQAHATLRGGGFAQVLVKPISTRDWQHALQRAVPGLQLHDTSAAPLMARGALPGSLALWDDASAARALGGNPAHADALRRLFLTELPSQMDALHGGEVAIRRDVLHRLRASCALVGAVRLDAAVTALERDPDAPAALHEMLSIARAMCGQAASND